MIIILIGIYIIRNIRSTSRDETKEAQNKGKEEVTEKKDKKYIKNKKIVSTILNDLSIFDVNVIKELCKDDSNEIK